MNESEYLRHVDSICSDLTTLHKALTPCWSDYLPGKLPVLPHTTDPLERFAAMTLSARIRAAHVGRWYVGVLCSSAGFMETDLDICLKAKSIRASDLLMNVKQTALSKRVTDDEKRAALLELIASTDSECNVAAVADQLRQKRSPGQDIPDPAKSWLIDHGSALRPTQEIAKTRIPEWLLTTYGVHMKIGAVKTYILGDA